MQFIFHTWKLNRTQSAHQENNKILVERGGYMIQLNRLCYSTLITDQNNCNTSLTFWMSLQQNRIIISQQQNGGLDFQTNIASSYHTTEYNMKVIFKTCRGCDLKKKITYKNHSMLISACIPVQTTNQSVYTHLKITSPRLSSPIYNCYR